MQVPGTPEHLTVKAIRFFETTGTASPVTQRYGPTEETSVPHRYEHNGTREFFLWPVK